MTEFAILAGVFGALLGSFLNVLIYRLPRGEDFVLTRSKCPNCGDQIPAYYNIPLLGFLALKGKCRACRQAISWRYPTVELLSALIFYFAFPTSFAAADVYHYVFVCGVSVALIVHFFIDLEHRLLLDKINIYLLMLILPYVVIFFAPAHWIVGGGLGFLGPLGISWVFYKVKGKIGLGGGDIKLWGVLGLLLGPVGIMTNIFFSSLLGSIAGIILIIKKRYQHEAGIPFGPLIIVVVFMQIFFPSFFDSLGLFH